DDQYPPVVCQLLYDHLKCTKRIEGARFLAPWKQHFVGEGAGAKTPQRQGRMHTWEDALITLVEQTVAPQCWKSVGGQCTMQYYPLGMALVVNATPEVHRQLADLLSTIRKQQEEQDREYTLVLKWCETSAKGKPKIGMCPKMTVCQSRWCLV